MKPFLGRSRGARLSSTLIALAGGFTAGCAGSLPYGLTAPVPPSPARVAEVEMPAPKAAAPPAIPPEMLQPGAVFSLADVVELALANSPQTRASYFQAKAAAAQLGDERGAFYPSLDLTASLTRAQMGALGGRFETLYTSYGPSLALNYLLFDFGGRRADAEEARQGLLAADLAHNATVQNLVFTVQQAYYGYLNSKAQLDAAREIEKQAETSLDAASRRHDAGVATIADVLQARTALSQARLNLLSAEGQTLALRGALATAVGLPANLPFDVGGLPGEAPIEPVNQAVDALIETARLNRPDLAALRALAEKAAAKADSARSARLPNLSLTGAASRVYYEPHEYERYSDNYSAGLSLRFSLFSGFSKGYQLQKARDEAGAATAQAASLEQAVVLQVWTSYYALQTATQRVRTSRDLLASAEQSERVAMGRYKEGVGTILDLLSAQAALANARAIEIQARSDWFVAVARLAHDTGVLPDLSQAKVVIEQKREP